MKVAFLERPDSDLFPGGDNVQLLAIENFMRKRGCEITRINDTLPTLSGFDLAILINLTRPCDTYLKALCAKNASVPFILFPVYWDLEKEVPKGIGQPFLKTLLKRVSPGTIRYAVNGLRFLRSCGGVKFARKIPGRFIDTARLLSPRAMIASTLQWANFVCPNSKAEIAHLKERFGRVELNHSCVVLNGIDLDEIKRHESLNHEREPCVVSVGAIGPRKNQLGLVRAARSFSFKVKLIGKPSPGCEYYARKVYESAPENVEFLGYKNRPEVLEILNKCKVYCQPSFIETPGLASLEAAALGCSVVVSDVGPVKEYFEENALYIKPDDPDSIATGIKTAMESDGPDPAKIHWFRERYNWDKALSALKPILESLKKGKNSFS